LKHGFFTFVLYSPQEYLRLTHKRAVSFIIPEPDPNLAHI